ncbi:MAG: hypothetical protein E6J72_13685 [Deltaproteobacteria bacterium]|nr:MAG: hypothetical protein E6J72_13685 [Deltaproteobacteria bacterium]
MISTLVVAPAATSISCCRFPRRGCHAASVYWPAGTRPSVNAPSRPVTAKYGWSTTPSAARIQGWTSHCTPTGTSAVGTVIVRRAPRTASPKFHGDDFAGVPCTLWRVSSLLTNSIRCPARAPTTRGSKTQPR